MQNSVFYGAVCQFFKYLIDYILFVLGKKFFESKFKCISY